jgi:hypothetical protein
MTVASTHTRSQSHKGVRAYENDGETHPIHLPERVKTIATPIPCISRVRACGNDGDAHPIPPERLRTMTRLTRTHAEVDGMTVAITHTHLQALPRWME